MRGERIFGERENRSGLAAKRKRMSLIAYMERNISSGSSPSRIVIRRSYSLQGNFHSVCGDFIQGIKSFHSERYILRSERN